MSGLSIRPAASERALPGWTGHIPTARRRGWPFVDNRFLLRPNARKISPGVRPGEGKMRMAEDPTKGRADPENTAALFAVIQAGERVPYARAPLDEKALDEIIHLLLAMIAKRGPAGPNLMELMDVVEQCIIFRALRRFRWHQARTAEFLGLKPQTLSEKIKRFDRRRPA